MFQKQPRAFSSSRPMPLAIHSLSSESCPGRSAFSCRARARVPRPATLSHLCEAASSRASPKSNFPFFFFSSVRTTCRKKISRQSPSSRIPSAPVSARYSPQRRAPVPSSLRRGFSGRRQSQIAQSELLLDRESVRSPRIFFLLLLLPKSS